MKKIKKWFLTSSMAISSIVVSQTALPASYDFNNFASSGVPANWTTNIPSTNVYATGGGGGSAAIKFGTGSQYVSVFTAGAMGTVSYVLKGYAGTGVTSWQGGFSA